jgi:hypothetical protein
MERLRRGLRSAEVVETHTLACAAPEADDAPWTRALGSLESGLRAMKAGKTDLRVILSNHFVRYALVPWSDQISDKDEEQAFIRHCFAQTYGDDAKHWALRMSPCGYGETQVASAIDQGLLEGVERVANTHGLRLVSLQPYLMAMFNQWHRLIPDSGAWFVIAEPGRLCVSQLQNGIWHTLRTVKVGDDLRGALLKLLEREFLISESGTERGTVFLYAPGYEAVTDLPGWTVRQLTPMPDALPPAGISFATSMSE